MIRPVLNRILFYHRVFKDVDGKKTLENKEMRA